MKKTLKLAVWTIAAVAVLGCEKEQGTEVVSDGVVVREFTASFGEPSTRTSLEGDGSVNWAAGDRIDYFSASSEGSISVPEAGPTVRMSVKMGANDSWFTAVYGATGIESRSADGSSFVISGAAPSKQDGLFPSAHVSVAHLSGASEVASSKNVKFKNLTSFLKFSIAGSGVARAEFSSNDGSGVSCGEKGLAKISFAEDGSFVASASGSLSSSIAVRLDGAGTYYISLLPQTLEKGFTIKCFDAYGEELGAVKYPSRVEIKSSHITNIGTIDQRLVPSSPALSSIVFQPDFYFRSFGAVNYDYAGGKYGTVKNAAEGTDDEISAFKVIAKNELVAGTTVYNLGSISTARYAVNPEVYNLSDAYWSFYGEDYLYMTRSTKWDVKFLDIEAGTKNIANVKFTITNANELNKGDNISVITLQAYDRNGVNGYVDSDKAAVVPRELKFKALAFSNSYKGVTCILPKDELYPTAKDAVENVPSVQVQYNGGAHLLNYIDVHYTEADGRTEYSKSLADVLAKYPDLDATFELVDYTLGHDGISQAAYGRVANGESGWYFQPTYPISATESKDVPIGGLEGVSAIYNKPIILVTLHQKGKPTNVVLAGYFKIMIGKAIQDGGTPTPSPSGTLECVVRDFGELPYTCAEDFRNTTKLDVSYTLLECVLQMNYRDFRSVYNCDGSTYVKKNGNFVRTTDYGTVLFTKDSGGSQNDVFTVSVTKAQKDRILSEFNGTVTLYTRFSSRGTGEVYTGFTVRIGPKPVAAFGTKIPVYWYNDVEYASNTVRASVRVPNYWREGSYANDDVTVYTKNLNNYFVGNGVTVSVTRADVNLTPKVTWLFSATQPAINGTKWTVSTDKKTLSYQGVAVVTIDSATGEITYLCNDTSKALLNLWAHDETEIAKILYCNVDIIASYDEANGCHIDLGSERIHVRFMRPIGIIENYYAVLREGVPSGDYVQLGSLFSAFDWMGYRLFKQTWSGGFAPCYYPDEDDPSGPVNWYGYYGISRLTVDVDNIRTDLTGSLALLRVVNPSAMCWVSNIDDRMAPFPGSIDITDASNLGRYVFNYYNPMGAGGSGSFNLYVPVTVTYAWGNWSTMIKVKVY